MLQKILACFWQKVITCSNYKSWDALGHTISSLLKVEKAGDNDGRADSGENKAEHEAPLPGKSQEHTSCDSHWRSMRRCGALPARDSARQGMKASRNTIADSFRSASGLSPRQARSKITTFGGCYLLGENAGLYQGCGTSCSIPFRVNSSCHIDVGNILECNT